MAAGGAGGHREAARGRPQQARRPRAGEDTLELHGGGERGEEEGEGSKHICCFESA